MYQLDQARVTSPLGAASNSKVRRQQPGATYVEPPPRPAKNSPAACFHSWFKILAQVEIEACLEDCISTFTGRYLASVAWDSWASQSPEGRTHVSCFRFIQGGNPPLIIYGCLKAPIHLYTHISEVSNSKEGSPLQVKEILQGRACLEELKKHARRRIFGALATTAMNAWLCDVTGP